MSIFWLGELKKYTPYLEIFCDFPVLVPMSVANGRARTKSEIGETRYNRWTARPVTSLTSIYNVWANFFLVQSSRK